MEAGGINQRRHSEQGAARAMENPIMTGGAGGGHWPFPCPVMGAGERQRQQPTTEQG